MVLRSRRGVRLEGDTPRRARLSGLVGTSQGDLCHSAPAAVGQILRIVDWSCRGRIERFSSALSGRLCHCPARTVAWPVAVGSGLSKPKLHHLQVEVMLRAVVFDMDGLMFNSED